MDRRIFLTNLTLGGIAGYALSGCTPTGNANTGAARIDRLGVQLYTVRDRMGEDVSGTLETIASIGYREVETAGLSGLTPDAFRAELDSAGLVSPAGHWGMNELRQNLEGTLNAARTLGQRWVVVPSLGGGERNADGFRRAADELNGFAEAARQLDMRIAYHNHDWEFEPLQQSTDSGASTGYELLVEHTDENLVDMELDLFWAVRGGHEPLELFARYPGRFTLCHVKDMADVQGEQRMTEVGSGEIDFLAIFEQAETAGLRHYFVEHDTPDDSLASIRTSYEYLHAAAM